MSMAAPSEAPDPQHNFNGSFMAWNGRSIVSENSSYSITEALIQAGTFYDANGYMSPALANDSAFSPTRSSLASTPSYSSKYLDPESFSTLLTEQLFLLAESGPKSIKFSETRARDNHQSLAGAPNPQHAAKEPTKSVRGARECLSALYKSEKDLHQIFSRSVFASTTYNLGPRIFCHKHRDFGNLPYGWCGVTALGNYDHKKGGHLILWDLGLVIEFPPGATILIPSAIVSHSNVPVGKTETRYSFTQYTAGGLFRWVSHGFQKADEFMASLDDNEKASYEKEAKERWAHGLFLIPRRK